MTTSTILISHQNRREVACYLTYIIFLTLYFFSDLALRPIWVDEALSYYQVSSRSFQEMLDSLGSGVNAIPYFYFIVLWGVDQVFELSPILLRLPSLLFALATIVFLHRILKDSFGNGVAFISCVSALLLSKDFILYSHEARPYSLYILAATLCLYSCIALLKEGPTSKRTLLANSLMAFALPSIHYVGIFYSICSALAVIFVGRAKGRYFSFLVIGSFLLGWVVFFLVHFSQMILFINKKGLIDATWIPRPELDQVFKLVLSMFSLTPVVSITLIAYVGYHIFSVHTIRFIENLDKKRRLIDTFFFVVALFWLAIPPVLYFFGAIGLPNLGLMRYFAPSLLAIVLMSALILRAFNPEYGSRSEVPWFFRMSGISVGVSLALVFLIYPMLVAVKDVFKAPSNLSQKILSFDYSYITSSQIPCVTNHVHLFFQYSFYRQDHQVLYFLRETQAEADGFDRFDKRLLVLSKDKLSTLPAFRFIYKKGTVNSFPAFNIHHWSKDNGYEVVDEGNNRGIEIYLVRKL